MKIRKYSKPFAIFLLLNFMNCTFAPIIANAMSSEPSPSFIGTDMVNLKTGDLNYSVPLFEVPGPESSYPISLNYNAGVRPEQDASWVGLGWNMDVGAITRNVKGIPDDFAGEEYQVNDGGGELRGDQIAKWEAGEALFMPYRPVQDYLGMEQYGVLHGKAASQRSSVIGYNPPEFAFYDCHAIQSEEGLGQYSTPEMTDGGTVPTGDNYSVNVNGISGSIEPVLLENATMYRHAWTSNYMLREGTRDNIIFKPFTQAKQYFRYKKEFANNFTASSPVPFSFNGSTPPSASYTSSLGYTASAADVNGYNASSMRLAGGKHIDYFLNSEISDGTAKTAGFINYVNELAGERTNVVFNSINGTTTTYNVSKRVGGFSITNEDGVSYHFALPVYMYGKTSKYGSNDPNCGPFGDAYRTTTSDAPFAYAWLLTSITGTDFIDKDKDGKAGEGDLGMWINFNYGKLTNKFIRSNPYEGPMATSDGTSVLTTFFQEVYFLDAISTRTHTALFSKSSRSDGQDANATVLNRVSPLKLNSAVLLFNDYIKSLTGQSSVTSGINAMKNGNGILEASDLALYSGLTDNIIKESVLNYDYSLCPGAPNSTAAAVGTTPGNGKLTLLSAVNYGSTGYKADNSTRIAPPVNFYYELENPQSTSITITGVPADATVAATANRTGSISLSVNPFTAGDIIKFSISNVVYYAALLKSTSATSYEVMFLGPNVPLSGQLNAVVTATQTKNPAYTSYVRASPTWGRYAVFADYWGYLKTDLIRTDDRGKEVSFATTSVSSKAADSWSLRKINTSLGASVAIDYESDTYFGVQMTKGQIFNILRSFRYSTGSSPALISSGVDYCAISAVKENDLFEFTVKEEINGKFKAGQTISITTMATVGTDSSSCGQDDFLISAVNTDTRTIQGTFVTPVSGIKSNPFWFRPVGGSWNSRKLYHNGSFITQTNPSETFGGGVRVKSITAREGNGEEYITAYSYKNRNNVSSGTTAYEAGLMAKLNDLNGNCEPTLSTPIGTVATTSFDINDPQDWQLNSQKFLNYYITTGAKALSNMDFISPGVMYEYVQLNRTGNGNAFFKSEEYQFQPYTWDMIQRVKSNQDSRTSVAAKPGMPEAVTMVTINDYTAGVGNIIAYREYDASGDPVQETKYNYTYNSLYFAVPGRLDRVYHEERLAQYAPYGSPASAKRFMAIVTKHSEYPSYLASISSFDYLKNVSATKVFHIYDLYNGQPTEVVTNDSYGQYFKQKNVPAYTKSVYANMGLKMNTTSGVVNRNMLNQLTASYTYKVNPANYNTHLNTLSASVTTWSNQWKDRVNNGTLNLYEDASAYVTNDALTVQDEQIWRAQSSYVWKTPKLNADGSYGDFTDFDWAASPTLHANWQKANEITKYDRFSNALEKKDINGNYTSVKLGYDYRFPLIGSANANSNELAYSGAEDMNSSVNFGNTSAFGGEVWAGQGVRDNTIEHTGDYSLKLTPGQNGFTYKARIKADGTGISMNKKYRASVWVYDNGNTSAKLYYLLQDPTGATASTPYEGSVAASTGTVISGAWKLLTIDIPLGTGAYTDYLLVIGCTNAGSVPAYFDDFRFHPLSETVSSGVYDRLTGLKTWSLDHTNFYFRRVYDKKYRPFIDSKETINGEIKTREYYYNFGK